MYSSASVSMKSSFMSYLTGRWARPTRRMMSQAESVDKAQRSFSSSDVSESLMLCRRKSLFRRGDKHASGLTHSIGEARPNTPPERIEGNSPSTLSDLATCAEQGSPMLRYREGAETIASKSWNSRKPGLKLRLRARDTAKKSASSSSSSFQGSSERAPDKKPFRVMAKSLFMSVSTYGEEACLSRSSSTMVSKDPE
ncbi:Vi polysaccharide biosynthesis protein VipB/TviC [Babesia caballi]|uniref:Vi polysaccharide biosynthesis protein VipB/TviC n=1 Tax=Babesia caballi TaxID=5871 RepID=A0AAV4LZJ9_BABCB|nr:Vi polysaccharide biosynthesis protein VipB/TviC [Babesia caballi]